MGKELFDASTAARGVFESVGQATGIDVASLCFESDEAELRQTQNAQLALYTVGVAAFRALIEAAPGIPVVGAAGHSVGEYAALAAAGVVSVEIGGRLVQRRGDLMARAGKLASGTMVAVLGLELDDVANICAGVDGVCGVANDNCPGQVVVSGQVAAVEIASERLTTAGAKRVLPLNVSGAFHSPLMQESAEAMASGLAAVQFGEASMPVYSNVSSKPGQDWAGLLEKQLVSPVRWRECVQNMLSDGFETFIECGCGTVLTGLLRRIDKQATGLAVNGAESLTSAIESLKEKQR